MTFRRSMATTILLAGLVSTPAAADEAGSCHFHGKKPAAEATVLGCAMQRKENLVKTGKLQPVWQSVKQERIEAVDGKKGKEWKVTFKDLNPTDQSKATLYMFFTLTGNFIAANFTGE